MTFPSVKFAVVGCGHIGKRHAEMVQRHPDAQLVALCDTKPYDQLELDGFDVPFFDQIEELLAVATSVDVVCICTPNGLHASQALLCLEAGKHVVIEKPMALTKADCEDVLFKALQADRHVFCVMQNRYSPPAVWLKTLVEQKQLGEIYLVQINCFWNRDERYYRGDTWHGDAQLDGGTLFTQFSHFVDMAWWLFGDIQNIQARFKDFAHQHSTDFEDTGWVTFDFVRGGAGILQYSTAVWNRNFESSLTIIGSKGTVKVGGQYMNEIVYCHVEDYEMPRLSPTNPANDYGPYKGSAANHGYVIENVVDVLNGRESIATNAMEGMKVVEIIERIYQTADNKYTTQLGS